MRIFKPLLIILLVVFGCAKPDAEVSRREVKNVAVVTAVGDVLLSYWTIDSIYKKLEQNNKDNKDIIYEYPFKNVKNELRGIVFCNLEGPLTLKPTEKFEDKNEKYYFSMHPKYVKALSYAGFDVISLANNHIKDCGNKGLQDSIKILKKVGIEPVGVGENNIEARKPVLKTENKIKVAFLAYDLVLPKSVWAGEKSFGAANADTDNICNDVKITKSTNDAVVVSLHWGKERFYDEDVINPDKERIEMAHNIIDAGASVILGHHSHTVEKIEKCKNGVIFYSLGNFVFAGTSRGGHSISIIARIILSRQGVESFKIIPVNIDPKKVKYSPIVLEGKEKDKFIGKLTMN